jgi:hypothetical protein
VVGLRSVWPRTDAIQFALSDRSSSDRPQLPPLLTETHRYDRFCRKSSMKSAPASPCQRGGRRFEPGLVLQTNVNALGWLGRGRFQLVCLHPAMYSQNAANLKVTPRGFCSPSVEFGPNRGKNEERVLDSERRWDPCLRKTLPRRLRAKSGSARENFLKWRKNRIRLCWKYAGDFGDELPE